MSLPEDAIDLFDLLARRAETAGYEPWLFAREEQDWRWWSWVEAHSAVGRIVDTLSGLRLVAPRVGLPGPLSPGTVVAALAVVRLGATPVGPEDSGVQIVTAGCARAATLRFRLEVAPALLPAVAPSGRGGPALGLPPELLAAATEAAARRDRPVLVQGPRPGPSVDLTGLAWSIASGAGLVLEPLTEALAATLLWARPTHLLEPGARLGAVADRLVQLVGGRDPAARLARRLGRLRRVWWSDEPPPAAARALFERIGAKVSALSPGSPRGQA